MKNCYAYDADGNRCELGSPDTVWVNANYARRLLGTQLIPSSIKRLKTSNGSHAWLYYQDILGYLQAEETTRGVCCYAHCRRQSQKTSELGFCEIHEQNARNALRMRVS